MVAISKNKEFVGKIKDIPRCLARGRFFNFKVFLKWPDTTVPNSPVLKKSKVFNMR